MNQLYLAEADTHGVMVAVVPPGDLSVQLQDKAQEANPDLRVEPLDNMHITLAYLGGMDDVNSIEDVEFAVETFAMDTDPLKFEVAGWGRFDNNGQHVLYASVNVPGIEEWRAKLIDYLSQVEAEVKQDFSFTPHITVAYSDDPIESFPEALNTQRDWVAKEVILAKGGEWESYPLTQHFTLVAGKIDNPFYDLALVEDFQFEVMNEINEALGPKASLYDTDWPIEQFDPYEVVPTQSWLKEEKFRHGPIGPSGEAGPAVVIRWQGVPYLYDGHHRNYTFRAQGVPTMDAQVIDLDTDEAWAKLNELRMQKAAAAPKVPSGKAYTPVKQDTMWAEDPPYELTNVARLPSGVEVRFLTSGNAADRYQYNEAIRAEVDGEVVGLIEYGYYYPDKSINIHNVRVEEEWQRRGIATALLQRAMELPHSEVDPGMLTDLGAQWWRPLTAAEWEENPHEDPLLNALERWVWYTRKPGDMELIKAEMEKRPHTTNQMLFRGMAVTDAPGWQEGDVLQDLSGGEILGQPGTGWSWTPDEEVAYFEFGNRGSQHTTYMLQLQPPASGIDINRILPEHDWEGQDEWLIPGPFRVVRVREVSFSYMPFTTYGVAVDLEQLPSGKTATRNEDVERIYTEWKAAIQGNGEEWWDGEYGRIVGGCTDAAGLVEHELGYEMEGGFIRSESGMVEPLSEWQDQPPYVKDKQSPPSGKPSYDPRELDQMNLEEFEQIELHGGMYEHYWNRAPDGTIVDVTGEQLGGDTGPRIIPPDDPRQALYWTFPSWRGDGWYKVWRRPVTAATIEPFMDYGLVWSDDQEAAESRGAPYPFWYGHVYLQAGPEEEVGGEAYVDFYVFAEDPEMSGGYLEINQLWVDPPIQRQGWASKLMDELYRLFPPGDWEINHGNRSPAGQEWWDRYNEPRGIQGSSWRRHFDDAAEMSEADLLSEWSRLWRAIKGDPDGNALRDLVGHDNMQTRIEEIEDELDRRDQHTAMRNELFGIIYDERELVKAPGTTYAPEGMPREPDEWAQQPIEEIPSDVPLYATQPITETNRKAIQQSEPSDEPIRAVRKDGQTWVWDGHHRASVRRRLGLPVIAYVWTEDAREASIAWWREIDAESNKLYNGAMA